MNYLLHVGMPQSASTFLQDVLFPGCPELNFISNRKSQNLKAFYNPLCSHEDYFWSEPAASSWLGEASDPTKLNVVSFEKFSCTTELSRQQVAERLGRLCPGAKCLIVVRNQLDAIVSAYAQHARVPNLLLPPFADHFELNIRDPKAAEFRRYFYDEFVGTYERLFGADAVLVLPYELLASEGPQFVERVCEFAGIAAPPAIDRVKVNKRVSANYVALRRIAQNVASPETLRRAWLGLPYPLRQKIKALSNRGRRFAPTLSDGQKLAVAAAFGPSNEKLSKRHGLQLAERYSYPSAATDAAENAAPALGDGAVLKVA